MDLLVWVKLSRPIRGPRTLVEALYGLPTSESGLSGETNQTWTIPWQSYAKRLEPVGSWWSPLHCSDYGAPSTGMDGLPLKLTSWHMTDDWVTLYTGLSITSTYCCPTEFLALFLTVVLCLLLLSGLCPQRTAGFQRELFLFFSI